MITDITEFLPKYPNIKKNSNPLFNPYSDNFYEDIYLKKEFYEEKLEKEEFFPEEAGGLLKHQKIISRFFSTHTLYDELLLAHDMGTGKTCSAIGATEQIKSEGSFRGALYLAKGEGLINNFINDLIFKCTDGRYIPDDYNNLTRLEKTHRKKKAIKDFYHFSTFETFAKYIKKSSNAQLQKDYNNFVIIIDEVHNLRPQEVVTGINSYEQFFRFLHTILGCKILLLSGTPMKDNVKEIASVMNLILPNNLTLETGENFINDYFTKTNNINIINSKGKNLLKSIFKGRISYLKVTESNVKVQFIGQKLGNLKHLIVDKDYMSDFQSEAYIKFFNGDNKDIYSNSRQSSLFVFPDGSVGPEGFSKYIIEKKSSKKFVDDTGKKRSISTFILNSNLRRLIEDHNQEVMLEKISKYSSKYSKAIRTILQSYKEGKSGFVYCEFVNGCGLILFGLLLELFGFKKASGYETENNFAPRYASLTNQTSTTSQIRDIVERFNQADNVNGQIINVIMGSKKINEGFSFFNIQVEQILTPWFNYSETSQAIARGIRFASHNDLIASGKQNPVVEIYQRVSLPKNWSEEHSIDLIMYEISENKDISIKSVERVMMESAFDCGLNYNRNKVVGKDGSRECQYMECDYKCDGLNSEKLKGKKLDLSTYQLYYNKEKIDLILTKIIHLFKLHFEMSLIFILENLSELKISFFEMLTSLFFLLQNNIPIKNKYGINSYIKEENNIFFLIENLNLPSHLSSVYYNKYPNIQIDYTFDDIIRSFYDQLLPLRIEKFFNSKNIEEVRTLSKIIPIDIIEYTIEKSIQAKILNLKKNEYSRELILQNFKNNIYRIDDIVISSFLKFQLRCLQNGTWKDCEQDIIDKFEERMLQEIGDYVKKTKDKGYNYYGQYNPDNKSFCIRDLTKINKKQSDARKTTSGQVCSTITPLETILRIVFKDLKMTFTDYENAAKYINKIASDKKMKSFDITKDSQLIELISKHIKLKKYMLENPTTNVRELQNILYFGTRTKDKLCLLIKDWFENNDLLQETLDCGDTSKKKPKE
tara:strand:- start:8163 stop:11300 length:3138 start_codon:yes stop_codon:yes gene_type:complete